MVTIMGQLRIDGILIGTVNAEVSERELEKIIHDTEMFINWKDINGNFGENFTIPGGLCGD